MHATHTNESCHTYECVTSHRCVQRALKWNIPVVSEHYVISRLKSVVNGAGAAVQGSGVKTGVVAHKLQQKQTSDDHTCPPVIPKRKMDEISGGEEGGRGRMLRGRV